MDLHIDDIFKTKRRINKEGTNCDINDIITWSQVIEGQLFGIITKKHRTCVYITLLEPHFYNHSVSFKEIRKKDKVCYNKLLYARKLMVL